MEKEEGKKTDVVEVGGAFAALEDQSKSIEKKKVGRKPNKAEDKTEQQGIRVKDSVWTKFRILVKRLETEALEKGEKQPTQGDVLEMAIEALSKLKK